MTIAITALIAFSNILFALVLGYLYDRTHLIRKSKNLPEKVIYVKEDIILSFSDCVLFCVLFNAITFIMILLVELIIH